jgi:hypothetical protein
MKKKVILEAQKIAQDANDFLSGRNVGTPYQDPGVVLAAIQGRAERLCLLLASFDRRHHGSV